MIKIIALGKMRKVHQGFYYQQCDGDSRGVINWSDFSEKDNWDLFVPRCSPARDLYVESFFLFSILPCCLLYSFWLICRSMPV